MQKTAFSAPIARKKQINWFGAINTFLLICAALLCVIPMIHILAISLSSSAAAAAGQSHLLAGGFLAQFLRLRDQAPSVLAQHAGLRRAHHAGRLFESASDPFERLSAFQRKSQIPVPLVLRLGVLYYHAL